MTFLKEGLMRGRWIFLPLLFIVPVLISCGSGEKGMMQTPTTVLVAPAAPSASLPVVQPKSNTAGVINDFFCGLKDSNGNLFFVDVGSHAVITNSANGNKMLRCSGLQPIPPPAHAVKFSGFDCDVFGGTTTRSMNIIDAHGRATLVCQFH